MDLASVQRSYARWAPVYDLLFGAVTQPGRRRATDYANGRSGRVLEVGVGTGLALPLYHAHLRVTGIDYSTEMLARARKRVADRNLSHVEALHRMDAAALDLPDAEFDLVMAMHVLSVVPDPRRALSEMARVCKPGGAVVITNHFRTETGAMARLEAMAARFADYLGWDAEFALTEVTGHDGLHLTESASLPPLGMMTLLVLERR